MNASFANSSIAYCSKSRTTSARVNSSSEITSDSNRCSDCPHFSNSNPICASLSSIALVLPQDSTPFRDSGAIELFLAGANITSVVGGAAQPQVTLDRLSNVIALNCPKKIGARFDAIIAPLYALCDELSLANTNLRQTRDLLLPRLISGEIDVSPTSNEKLPG